jgi:hypothetical protein
MTSPLFIFVAGITGVFVGMGFLYIAVRLTSWAVDKAAKAPGEEKP